MKVQTSTESRRKSAPVTAPDRAATLARIVQILLSDDDDKPADERQNEGQRQERQRAA